MTTPNVLRSVNPATEELLATYAYSTPVEVEQIMVAVERRFRQWRVVSFAERRRLMHRAAELLRERKPQLAKLITLEMGKPIVEAEGEVEKCAWNCDFYADQAAALLADQPHPSNGTESYVSFPPLGPVLAIMPWNYPLWQVLRFAAPALMAGNTAVLKHASNVPQCALAIEQLFQESGFPPGVFRVLFVDNGMALDLINDPRIAAVTVTGSDRAGSQIASMAGQALKKTVLELGGSDPFIIMDDADLHAAVTAGVQARYQNAGQSCVAAKRFLVVESIYDAFVEEFVAAVQSLRVGNPLDRTTQMGPLARADLRDTVEQQLQRSLSPDATVLCGGTRLGDQGYFFTPTVVQTQSRSLALVKEEVFGPIATIIKTRDATQAIAIANNSPYGLGASLWTQDLKRARMLARDLEVGFVAINGRVASDPRLPFGGVKRSGYGRELSEYGIREFVNIQTVWIGPPKG
jgi:acyl-CoA reductase-like NAD-dependent aldehyde dehydrogenase